MVFLHHLHEVRTVFGGHQAADVLMMTVFFVFAACGLDTERAAVSVEVDFDLLAALGLLIVDASLITQRSGRSDIHEIAIPAKDIAADVGLPKAANVVAIGALIAATGIVQFETVIELLTRKFGQRSPDVLVANKRALRLGADYVIKMPA